MLAQIKDLRNQDYDEYEKALRKITLSDEEKKEILEFELDELIDEIHDSMNGLLEWDDLFCSAESLINKFCKNIKSNEYFTGSYLMCLYEERYAERSPSGYFEEEEETIESEESAIITTFQTIWMANTLILTIESTNQTEKPTPKTHYIDVYFRNLKTAEIASADCDIKTEFSEQYHSLLAHVRINSLPAAIELSKVELYNTDNLSDTVFNIIKAADIDLWVKQMLFGELKSNNFDPERLLSFTMIPKELMRELLEILCDFGWREMPKETGEALIIAWNNKNSDLFQFKKQKLNERKNLEKVDKSLIIKAEEEKPKHDHTIHPVYHERTILSFSIAGNEMAFYDFENTGPKP